MIDWEPYGPIYSVAPGIKKINDLPIIEFYEHQNRYLNLKKKCKENIFFDDYYSAETDKAICNKLNNILKSEYPSKTINFKNFVELGYAIQEDIAIFHRSNKLIALHVSFPSVWKPKEKIGLSFAQIHQPVPGMKNFLKNEDKYVQMMVEATTPIIRYVWGEHYGYFFIINSLRALFFVFLGGSYMNIVKTYYPIAFLVMLSVWIGYYVHKKIPEDLFKRLIIIAITLIGILIFFTK